MIYSLNYSWHVVFVHWRAEKEIKSLPLDMRAHFARIIQLIQTHGLENIHEPYIKHLAGKLWEMRMKGKEGVARSIYMAASGKKLVILHSFVKKTQKTPQGAIELAHQRAKEAGLL